jgi:hypothetical protein
MRLVTCPLSVASPGQDVVWVQRYGTGLYGENTARRVVVSPDGQPVYVTGESKKPANPYEDFVTIAYDACDPRSPRVLKGS